MIEMSYKIGSCWEFVKVIILGWDSGGGGWMLTVVSGRGKRPVTDAGTLGQVEKMTQREPPLEERWWESESMAVSVCHGSVWGCMMYSCPPLPDQTPPPQVCQDLLPLICMVLPFWFRHCRSVICRCILSFIICEKKKFFSSYFRHWQEVGVE